ncbi:MULTISPECIES: hypothetical protein [unclassified Flavobacterium]|uniref:hypothetical protein n=1 Tax=unclassified Flavobacterium TaxID=196869 RepID=UPI00057C7E20|nr:MULTISPECIES: hypothetical protein [unclassified Flavobacterium]KIA98543.1 hypothetical protein OA93_08565 [Flavobacterium sp. KMS]MEA9414575.1 hypothetical protein [Flavobacterium sp. PL02]
MKKLLIAFAFTIVGLSVTAQAKVIKGINDAGDVATFELDCSKSFQVLDKGLRYTIVRHEFKGAEMKNSYRVMLVMDGFYTTTLNNSMTISAVFGDGSIVKTQKIIEDDGYFDGACTLKLKEPRKLLDLDIKQIIVHANKDVVYTIPEKNKVIFKKNLENILNAK